MKKRNLLILTSILLTIILFTSYAIFVLNTKEYKASELLVSNLLYGIQIDNVNTNIATTDTTKVFKVKITSLNGIDSKYSLEYKITNGNTSAKVYYLKEVTPQGDINQYSNSTHTKEITVVIETDSSVTVEFNVSGGYSKNGNPTSKLSYTPVTKKGYEVTVNVPNGNVDKSPKQVESNGTVTFTVTAGDGYTVEGATVSDGCTIDGSTVTASKVIKDITCTVTLIKKKTLADFIQEKYQDIYKGTRNHFNQTVGNYDSDNTGNYDVSGLYKESGNFTEDGKDVYYFSGNIATNWVSFAGYLWRIIRTNEDGSVRLLYAGPESSKGTGTNQFIENKRTYNQEYQNTMYVGYKYGEVGDLNSNRQNTHYSPILGEDNDQNDTGSTVTLNGWYNKHINISDGNTRYQFNNYISRTAIYCNDRATNNYQETNTMYYAAYDRLITNKRPSFKCGVEVESNNYKGMYATADARDKFSGINIEASLTNPIGLITADEVIYAGGTTTLKNSVAYYYKNATYQSATGTNSWWTMSPYMFSNSYYRAAMFLVAMQYGSLLDYDYVNLSSSVIRPVLSLKSCVTLSDATGEVSSSKYDPLVVQPISDSCAASDN